ncbi:hypothetical protein [Alkalihalobacillus sp. LMS39]|uniref:hypothetical protein n=1 Tax=Alkalihalobacillus sp. LMS39 TaxID=2924032 RepID=UPI001FB54248|nr:hypothetical protein [Alkalihalobacillus sp. LMS39]UOE92719.1 hypothetical protein MM271_15960 [Alkalihalobacillus sp. LMS39]
MQPKKQPSASQDSIIQLKQKIIHYRSEVSRYKQQLEDYEKRLQASEAKEQTQVHIEEKTEEPRIDCQAYFSYSTILSNSKDEDTMILGNFIIENTGNQPLTTPIICLQTLPADACVLSGKIKYHTRATDQDEGIILDETATEEWTYVHPNWQEKMKASSEHWLRPIHQTVIEPGEQLFFSNFSLLLTPIKDNHSIIMKGFVYSQEIQKGRSALNQIVLNY